MRAFVTGSSGFVGGWLVPHLRQAGDEVVEADAGLDVTDGPAVGMAVAGAEPEAIYHLAAFTHVGASWDAPEEVLRVNVMGTLSVLRAARSCSPPPTVVLVSSAEVYGRVEPGDLPVTEDAPLRPVSPYAASKVSAEYLGLQAHLAHGLPVVRARPFNHVGPGQAPTFAVPALARRIVEAGRAGRASIPVGNLAARRDFTDVRDVVRAYRMLVLAGEPGEAYNVCSGRDVSIDAIVHRLLELSGAALRLEPDPALSRPADVPVMRGDPGRLEAATGWRPEIGLDETLRAVLEHWEAEAGSQ
ncbi:MAG: GDP-mannose 4,6-dehydratase [Acidimicrobiales bacterium]